jgi:hypothetical protein
MKRKKAAVPAVVLNNVPVEGVIDLDSEPSQSLPMETGQLPNLKTEFHVQEHVGETVVLQPGQKAKRKYTRRAKKTESRVVPVQSFVDTSAIRSARIQAFIDYVDGNKTFDEVAAYDDHLRKLLETAAEISVRLLADAHAKATEKINQLAEKVDG